MSAVVICWPRILAAVRKSIVCLQDMLTTSCLHSILQTAGLNSKRMYRIPLAENARYIRLTRNDPKAARSPKLPCWTARVKRIGAHDA